MRLNVKVLPNAKEDKLVMEEGMSRVYLTLSNKDPKTNKTLIKFLAAHFNVKKNRISIISGLDKREKLIDVIKG
jgi:uncharacterized protein YggU (UPF0235/DUF167 family)